MQQTADNITRRVVALGVTEPSVQVIGLNRILVELPSVTDEEQAINTIQQTGLLEFVDFTGMSSQIAGFTGKKILTTYQLHHQPDANAAGDYAANPQTGQPFTTVITGAGLQSAVVQLQSNNQWVVAFQLTSDGAATFGPFTAAHVGQPLAIVVDGRVVSVPVINSRLDTGGVIQGNFTQQSANQLALQLRSGSLPIPLRIVDIDINGVQSRNLADMTNKVELHGLVSLNYPYDWKVLQDALEAMIVSPQDVSSLSDANFTAEVSPINSSDDIASLAQQTISQQQKAFADEVIEAPTFVALDGANGLRTQLKGTDNGVVFHLLFVIARHPNTGQGVLVAFTSKEEEWQSYQPNVDLILNTLKWSN